MKCTGCDKQNMIGILERWKAKQDSAKPLLVVVNTSGGGHRSATFTMSVLQHLDSITHGDIMKKIFLVNGASGGMIGATYFRELYLQKLKGKNHLGDSLREELALTAADKILSQEKKDQQDTPMPDLEQRTFELLQTIWNEPLPPETTSSI